MGKKNSDGYSMTCNELIFGTAIKWLRKVVPTSKGMWRLSRLAMRTRADRFQCIKRKTAEGFEMDLRLSCYPDIVMYYGVYEIPTMRIIRLLLKQGDVAVDVGANIGYITLNMAKCVGMQGKVLAFEPVPPTYDRLRRNIRNNACTQVQTFSNAVGETGDHSANIFLPKGGDNAHSLSSLKQFADSNVFKVDIVRIDDVINQPVQLIKIDVEGAEVSVVRGAAETIKRSHPYIIFEYNQEALARFGHCLQDVFKVIQDTGVAYEAFDIDGNGKRLDMKLALGNSIVTGTNILLRPRLSNAQKGD